MSSSVSLTDSTPNPSAGTVLKEDTGAEPQPAASHPLPAPSSLRRRGARRRADQPPADAKDDDPRDAAPEHTFNGFCHDRSIGIVFRRGQATQVANLELLDRLRAVGVAIGVPSAKHALPSSASVRPMLSPAASPSVIATEVSAVRCQAHSPSLPSPPGLAPHRAAAKRGRRREGFAVGGNRTRFGSRQTGKCGLKPAYKVRKVIAPPPPP